MRDNYEDCLAITLKWEGGDVDHPDDPGGKTRWGITQARYNEYRASKKLAKQSVFLMGKPEMLEIYKTGYWDAVKGDTLAYGVDLATWDYGVNSGPGRARNTLLASVGGTDIQTIQKICAKRLAFVQGLKIWKTFGKGWSRRIADIEARGVKMSTTHKGPKQSVMATLRAEADKARVSASNATTKAKVSVGGATASGAGSATDVDQLVSLGLLALAVVGAGFVIWYVIKGQNDKERAEAYARVAAEGV